jgi:hypothetical protein
MNPSPNPCHICKNPDADRMFCRRLQHTFESGYAMRSHSATCGGYEASAAPDQTCPRCRGGGSLDVAPCWSCEGRGTVPAKVDRPRGFLAWLCGLLPKAPGSATERQQ